jgi:hypothetical protein
MYQDIGKQLLLKRDLLEHIILFEFIKENGDALFYPRRADSMLIYFGFGY